MPRSLPSPKRPEIVAVLTQIEPLAPEPGLRHGRGACGEVRAPPHPVSYEGPRHRSQGVIAGTPSRAASCAVLSTHQAMPGNKQLSVLRGREYRPDGLTFGWRRYLERHFVPCPERYATGIHSSR